VSGSEATQYGDPRRLSYITLAAFSTLSIYRNNCYCEQTPCYYYGSMFVIVVFESIGFLELLIDITIQIV
jgi:hypothetical protein